MTSEVFQIYEHVIPCQYIREYARATAVDQEATLSLAIKQYKPRTRADDARQKVTLIGAHALGIPKELYEPLWSEVSECIDKIGLSIESIWIADVSNHGASAALNEEKLGNDPSLFDHSRDLMGMINHFRSEMPRPIVGFGHSIGGLQLVQLSLTHPRLFDSLILMEPIIFDVSIEDYRPAFAALARPDYWPSREAAMAQCQRSSFYKSWDSRALDLWIQHGLREVTAANDPRTNPTADHGSSTGFTLSTSKHQELLTYLRPTYPTRPVNPASKGHGSPPPDLTPANKPQVPFYRPEPLIVFHNLPFLRPPTSFLLGTASTFLMQPGLRERLINTTGSGVGGSGGVAAQLVREVHIPGGGHLAPLEKPRVIAEKIAEILSFDIERWRKVEEQVASEWQGREGRARRTIDETMVRYMGEIKSQAKRHKI